MRSTTLLGALSALFLLWPTAQLGAQAHDPGEHAEHAEHEKHAEHPEHSGHTGHARHAGRMAHGGHRAGGMPLGEAGNGAFGAIQEVVRELMQRPETDWSRVDLEALRRHFVDMRNMTLYVDVLEREPVSGGIRFRLRGTTDAADASVRRALAMHGHFIERERGWTVSVTEDDAAVEVVVTTADAAEVLMVRALGYIGFMALGDHHQQHHWMIATGSMSHSD